MLKARQGFITEMLPLRSIIINQLYLVLNMKQIAGFRYIKYYGVTRLLYSSIMSHTVFQL